jgi:starvation-inducible DNA-binding protein
MNPTRNDLSADVREKASAILNQEMAHLTDLQSQTKQAHWNVRGPNFIALHKLFDELAGTVGEHIDETAERITALGGVAKGTIRMAAAVSKLPEYPLTGVENLDHVKELALRFAQVAASVRKAIDATNELGDLDTADLFTGISRDLDKSLWFLDAHKV